jgi:hypothetical protein
LGRPRNHAVYEPGTTLEHLAALYGVGIAKVHAFIDGNKRMPSPSGRISQGPWPESRHVGSRGNGGHAHVAIATVGEHALEQWLLARCGQE